jgi:PIN domain nuclease of toxin-antitoxin system
MKLLLDTHVLLWAAWDSERLSATARSLLQSPSHQPMFSAASIWEMTIKRALERADFQVDVRVLRRGLLDNGYLELPITSEHTLFIEHLPPLHKDPFDRLLIAQATVEGITLLTADALVLQYSGPIQAV